MITKNRIKTLTLAALFSALCCVATFIIRIPLPTGGYANMGDTILLLSAFFLGPWWGALASGVGSALADIIGGYAIYAPATLVIKMCMACLAGYLYKNSGKKFWQTILFAVLAEAIMIGGYFIFEVILLHSFAAAAVGIYGNLTQAVFGIITSVLLVSAIKKNNTINGMFENI